MMSFASKFLVTMRICLVQLMAYRLNFLLLVIAPAFVFFVIKFNLWYSLFREHSQQVIMGYDLPRMLEYQALTLVVALLSQSYSNLKLSEDIRLGRISAFLLYPFEFLGFHCAAFFANTLLQLVLCVGLLCGLAELGWLPSLSVEGAFLGMLFGCFSALLWFLLMFMIGLLAFWIEETWVIRVILLVCTSFFSGSLIPLELFPQWLRSLLVYLPFPYLTFLPVKIFSGDPNYSFAPALAMLCLWIGALILLIKLVWRRGIRLYSAAGI